MNNEAIPEVPLRGQGILAMRLRSPLSASVTRIYVAPRGASGMIIAACTGSVNRFKLNEKLNTISIAKDGAKER